MSKINVVCPHCLKINAIPKKDSYTKANCGSCQKLFIRYKLPIELNETNFDHVVVNSELPWNR